MNSWFRSRHLAPTGRPLAHAASLALLSVLLPAAAAAAGAPASMTLAPASAQVAIGATAPYTAALLDASGQPAEIEADSSVGFAVDDSPIASVTIDDANPLVGDVLGKAVGTTTVRAFYVRNGQQTNIFASAAVEVIAACGAGHAACDGRTCVDLLMDANNCGTCGRTCPGGVCSAGACASGSAGSSGVSGDDAGAGGTSGAGGGMSAAVGGMAGPVGGMSGAGGGMSTAGGGMSGGGDGSVTCLGGNPTACHGTCVDVFNDPNNCGACGHACSDDQDCNSGSCASRSAGGSDDGCMGCSVRGGEQSAGIMAVVALFGAMFLVRRQRPRRR